MVLLHGRPGSDLRRSPRLEDWSKLPAMLAPSLAERVWDVYREGDWEDAIAEGDPGEQRLVVDCGIPIEDDRINVTAKIQRLNAII